MSRSLAEFEVVRRGLRRERFWRAQVDRALSALTLDKAERRIICSALFDRPTRGPLLLGNQHVRNASRTSMVSTMCDLFESEPGRKLYLITGGGLRGVKTLGDPSTDLVVFERAIDKKLRRHHLSGLLSFEFDIVKPRGNETDYPVLWHAHGLVGREDGLPIGFEELRNTFAASRAFPSWNDGVGLHVKPVRRTIADLARSAAYLADPIHQLKVRYPDPKRPSRLKMRSTRSGFPPSDHSSRHGDSVSAETDRHRIRRRPAGCVAPVEMARRCSHRIACCRRTG